MVHVWEEVINFISSEPPSICLIGQPLDLSLIGGGLSELVLNHKIIAQKIEQEKQQITYFLSMAW